MSRPMAFFHLNMEEDPNSAEDKTRNNISGEETSAGEGIDADVSTTDMCCPSDEEKPYNKSVAQDDSDSSVFYSSDEEDPYSVNLPEDAPASETGDRAKYEVAIYCFNDDSDSSVFYSDDEEYPYLVNLPEYEPASETGDKAKYEIAVHCSNDQESEVSCKGVEEGQVDHSDVQEGAEGNSSVQEQEGAVGYSGARKAPSINWERLCQIRDNVNSEKDQDHEIAEYELFPKEFCDALVKVQARRMIYYFYILKSAVLESKVLEEVFVKDYTYETSACVIQPVDMYRLLDFLHYGSVTLSTLGRAKNDYKIATTYKLPRYAEFCTKYMCKNMTKDDAPEFLAFSTQNNLTELREICQNMIE